MTSLSLLLAVGCPKQQWESVLEEKLDAFTEPWPCPSLPSAALPPQPKSRGSGCSILFLPSKPRPKEALRLCSDTGTLLPLALWALFLANLGSDSQVLVQICSSGKLRGLHGLCRFCPHHCPWDWGAGRVLLARHCMCRLKCELLMQPSV